MLINAMIFLGAALMVFNVVSYLRMALYVKGLGIWGAKNEGLYIPTALLVLFLLGYLAVGLFGKPDIIIAGILFFGSVFVFVMYLLVNKMLHRVVENGEQETRLRTAEESNRVKSAFLASISHEMRTPLNVILGLDNIALKNPNLAPETRDQLEKIGQSGRHLLGMINNILDINRLETEPSGFLHEDFSLAGALAQVNAIVQTQCDRKGLAYISTLAEDADLHFLGDETQLKQILLSLLDNAVKYTDAPGEVRLTADCLPGPEENVPLLRFTVSDTGIGIDPDFLPKIFDLFSREEVSMTARYGGSGLSLSLTKRVLDRAGGAIKVESEKGKGSVFTITVPMKTVAAPMPLEESEEGEALTGCRILIAEDLPENAEIVADLLELEGAETEHAENGQIAVDMFSASAPRYYDAILMDLRMPVMDGLESARRIRALERPDAKAVPIIALTANAFEEDVRNSLDAGMDAHLAKPADPDTLYGTLRHFINERGSAT